MNKAILPFLAMIVLTGCYQSQYSEVKTEDGRVAEVYFQPASSSGDSFTPQKFGVRFTCEHGLSFVIERATPELYKKLTHGELVKITYREVYHATKKATNFHDFEFIDANPVKLGEL